MEYRFIFHSNTLLFGNQADIQIIIQIVPILPKVLPSKTLDTVALHSLSNFSRNRQSKATAIAFVFADISDKLPVLDPFASFR